MHLSFILNWMIPTQKCESRLHNLRTYWKWTYINFKIKFRNIHALSLDHQQSCKFACTYLLFQTKWFRIEIVNLDWLIYAHIKKWQKWTKINFKIQFNNTHTHSLDHQYSSNFACTYLLLLTKGFRIRNMRLGSEFYVQIKK